MLVVLPRPPPLNHEVRDLFLPPTECGRSTCHSNWPPWYHRLSRFSHPWVAIFCTANECRMEKMPLQIRANLHSATALLLLLLVFCTTLRIKSATSKAQFLHGTFYNPRTWSLSWEVERHWMFFFYSPNLINILVWAPFCWFFAPLENSRVTILLSIKIQIPTKVLLEWSPCSFQIYPPQFFGTVLC